MTSTRFVRESPKIVSSDALYTVFQKGEKPRDAWRLGMEHEKFGFRASDLAPLPYHGQDGIEGIFERLIRRFDWEPQREDAHVIGLYRGGESISLEPGGQLELSGAPLRSVHDVRDELRRHLRELYEVSAELGVFWVGMGTVPQQTPQDMPQVPKERYGIMRRYLGQRGELALSMMHCTAGVQTNFDYADEHDMRRKLRLAMRITPLLTALYANSPLFEGEESGYLSARAHTWQHTDPDRCGLLGIVFDADFGYDAYVAYALDVPMFFIHREGHYLDCSPLTFRRFLADGFRGHEATEQDWELHLTTLFPEARLKSYIELRMVDSCSPAMMLSLAALTRGLFYDQQALAEAETLLAGWDSLRVLQPLLQRAAKFGLHAEADGSSLRFWCQRLVAIAAQGLRRLAVAEPGGVRQDSDGVAGAPLEDEGVYLDPLVDLLTSGETGAHEIIRLWREDAGNRSERARLEKVLRHVRLHVDGKGGAGAGDDALPAEG